MMSEEQLEQQTEQTAEQTVAAEAESRPPEAVVDPGAGAEQAPPFEPEAPGGGEDQPSAAEAPEPSAWAEKAKQYGLDESAFEDVPEEHRESVVNAVALAEDKRQAELGRQLMEQKEAPAQPAQPPAEQPPAPQPEAGQYDFDAEIAKLEEDGYDDGVLNPMKAMAGAVKGLQAQLAQYGQQAAQQQAEAQKAADAKAYSAWQASLPESHKAALADPEVMKEFGETWRALDKYHASQGKTLPADDLAERAFRLAAHPKLKDMARKELLSEAQAASEGQTFAPSGRQRSGAAPEESTEEAVQRVMDRMGATRTTGQMLEEMETLQP